MAPSARILIADDQRDVLEALRLLLQSQGYRAESAAKPREVLRNVEESDFDLLLMDLNYARDTTSGREGFELIPGVRTLAPHLPILVMTAWGSVEGAVEAMRLGASDYLQKPWDNDRLMLSIRNHVERGRALRQTERLSEQVARHQREPGEMVTSSAAMRSVLELTDRVAPSDASILISGDHGTGKELVARRIHARSRRASGPLITVDTGAIGEGVFESELFGHVRGAFTDARADRVGCFELADGGTLFLDEIGNMPLGQQAKLLRVMQTGEFQTVGSSRIRRTDVRIIAATNANLAQFVAAKQFREDLLYRLNTVEIKLPPLRDRPEDVAVLATHFLARLSHKYNAKKVRFTPTALAALSRHNWPGNVRELEHTVERAVLVAPGPEIDVDSLLLPANDTNTATPDGMTLQEVERWVIQRALARHARNIAAAAKALGASRSALYRRLHEHGMDLKV